MKKLFTSIMVLSLAFSLFGCGESGSTSQPDMSADNTTEATSQGETNYI